MCAKLKAVPAEAALVAACHSLRRRQRNVAMGAA